MQISCAVTAELISAFVFAIRIVQSLFYLNTKFQAPSHLFGLYSPVCVGPGKKKTEDRFSHNEAHFTDYRLLLLLLFLFERVSLPLGALERLLCLILSIPVPSL